MTQVVFHANVTDPLAYACRLLRKACRVGARVVVWGPAESLKQLDRLLWTFEPAEFVPHVLIQIQSSAVDPDRVQQRQETPLWLVETLQELPEAPVVLLNLGDEPAEQLERFDRVIEIVSTSEHQLLAARTRWKHYLAAGHSPQKHEVSD
jgi:DNA polymerase-3 subunit chi